MQVSLPKRAARGGRQPTARTARNRRRRVARDRAATLLPGARQGEAKRAAPVQFSRTQLEALAPLVGNAAMQGYARSARRSRPGDPATPLIGAGDGRVQRRPRGGSLTRRGSLVWVKWRRAAGTADAHREHIAELKASLAGEEPDKKLTLLEEIYQEAQQLEGALRAQIDTGYSTLADLEPMPDGRGERDTVTETDQFDSETRELASRIKVGIEQAVEEGASIRRMFPPKMAAVFAEKYRTEVKPIPGGGCMTAMYKGFDVLYSSAFSRSLRKEVYRDSQKILKKTGRDTNSVDRVMRTLRKHGRAGGEMVFKYKRRARTWAPDPTSAVLGAVSTDLPGWYFFGLSISGAYHTVTLAVDTTEGSARIYWMDQFTRGFTKEVTGSLVAEMKEDWLRPSYGFTTTRIWPILPGPETTVSIE